VRRIPHEPILRMRPGRSCLPPMPFHWGLPACRNHSESPSENLGHGAYPEMPLLEAAPRRLPSLSGALIGLMAYAEAALRIGS